MNGRRLTPKQRHPDLPFHPSTLIVRKDLIIKKLVQWMRTIVMLISWSFPIDFYTTAQKAFISLRSVLFLKLIKMNQSNA